MTDNVSDSMLSRNLYTANRKCLNEIDAVDDEGVHRRGNHSRVTCLLQDVRTDNIITVSIASRLPRL